MRSTHGPSSCYLQAHAAPARVRAPTLARSSLSRVYQKDLWAHIQPTNSSSTTLPDPHPYSPPSSLNTTQMTRSRDLRRRNYARDGLARLSLRLPPALRRQARLRHRRSFAFTWAPLRDACGPVGRAATWCLPRLTCVARVSRVLLLVLMVRSLMWVYVRSRAKKIPTRRAVCGANRSRSSFSCGKFRLSCS
jgi:hypothetical protein